MSPNARQVLGPDGEPVQSTKLPKPAGRKRPWIEYHHSAYPSWGGKGKALLIMDANGLCRESMLILIGDMERDVREKLAFLRQHEIEDVNLVKILERLDLMRKSEDFEEVTKTEFDIKELDEQRLLDSPRLFPPYSLPKDE
jgi:hypothetical protein